MDSDYKESCGVTGLAFCDLHYTFAIPSLCLTRFLHGDDIERFWEADKHSDLKIAGD